MELSSAGSDVRIGRRSRLSSALARALLDKVGAARCDWIWSCCRNLFLDIFGVKERIVAVFYFCSFGGV